MRIKKPTKKKLFGLILFSLIVTGTCEATLYTQDPEPSSYAAVALTQGQRFRTPPGLLFRTAIKKGWDMSEVDVKGLKRKEYVYYEQLLKYYYKSNSSEEAKKEASIYAVNWEYKEKPWKFAFSHSRGRTRDNLAIFAGRLIGTGLIVFPLALFGFIIFYVIRLCSNKKKDKTHLINNVTPTKEYVKKHVVWLCENCKTENEGNLDICGACGVEITEKPQNVQGGGEGYNLDRTKYARNSNISNQQEDKLLYNENQTDAKISKEQFIHKLRSSGGCTDDFFELIDERWDTACDAAEDVNAAMPNIGLLSSKQRINSFMSVCRHLDLLIEKDEIDSEDAQLALGILRLSNKKFNKAIVMFETYCHRYNARERAEMPSVAREYLAGIEYGGGR